MQTDNSVSGTSEAPRSHLILLVHGTFARGAEWARADSRLSRALMARLDGLVCVEPFEWSGSPTASARFEAAERLARRLEDNATCSPSTLRFVIAHSHGGNIALYALRDDSVAANVDGLACMATPFLVARRRDLGREGTRSILLVLLILALVGYGWLIGPALPASIPWGLPLFMYFVAVALVLGQLYKRWHVLADGLIAKLRLADLPPSKLLVLRATGDEASALLLFFQFITVLGVRLFHSLQRLQETLSDTFEAWSRRKAALAAATAGGILIVATQALLASTAAEGVTTGLLIDVLLATLLFIVLPIFLFLGWTQGPAVYLRFVAALALVPAALLLALCMVPFDWRVAMANLLSDVTAEATPPGKWTVHQFVPMGSEAHDGGPPPMAHSAIYDDGRAIDAIVEWIRSRPHGGPRWTDLPAHRAPVATDNLP